MIETQTYVYLGEGKPPPKIGYKRLFNTPSGIFPKLVDVATKYNMFKSNIHRRYINPSKNFKEWFVIHNPTKEQSQEAVDNVNAMYTAKYEEEDNCPVCNEIDDLIFKEGCWLLKVAHNHEDPDKNKAVIHYTFRKDDYRVPYPEWVKGSRPHLNETKNNV